MHCSLIIGVWRVVRFFCFRWVHESLIPATGRRQAGGEAAGAGYAGLGAGLFAGILEIGGGSKWPLSVGLFAYV